MNKSYPNWGGLRWMEQEKVTKDLNMDDKCDLFRIIFIKCYLLKHKLA